MALSMDEQRMLAEIERRLAAEDPGLAARLSSFRRRPGPAAVLRSPRVRIAGSLLTVMLVAMVSLMVYAIVPFRGHATRSLGGHPQASPVHPVLTVPGGGDKVQPAIGPAPADGSRGGGQESRAPAHRSTAPPTARSSSSRATAPSERITGGAAHAP